MLEGGLMNGNLAVPSAIQEYDGLMGMFISKFLNSKAPKTKVSYENTIKNFFNVGDIFEIDANMIAKVLPHDAENFRDELLEKGLKLGSVQNKIHCMQSLYTYLGNKCVSNVKQFRLLQGNPFNSVEMPRIETISEDQLDETYGSFTEHEIARLLEVALPEFKLLYELAARTGIRKNSLVNLNINTDFKQVGYKMCISIRDKGKNDLKMVDSNLYKKCVEFASQHENGKIFSFTDDTTVNYNLKKDLTLIGISIDEQKARRLVFHSFRDSACELALEYSNNNIYEANKMGNHSSVDTTKERYISKDTIGNEVSSKFGFGYKKCEVELKDKLNQMTKFDLKNLIMDLDLDTQKAILKKMHNMGM